MKKNLNTGGRIFFVVFILSLISACVPTNKLSYFNDIDFLEKAMINPKIQKTIMPFDRLYIRILSIDPQTREIFNFPEEVRNSTSPNSVLGYLVDENGDIEFPFVGDINIGSLSLREAGLKIQNALNEYVPNTTVIVKYIDNQVAILGEVERQGVYPFTQDKLNIYEALALGGGLTRYGNRKNVVLIRQEGEKIMHYKLDLSNSKIAIKDLYYVLPNDVIIVEPLKSISTSYPNVTYQSILSSVTTLVAILVLYFQVTQ